MSLPPKLRGHSGPPRHRLREGAWLVGAFLLLLLIVGTIAPDSWRHRLFSKLRRGSQPASSIQTERTALLPISVKVNESKPQSVAAANKAPSNPEPDKARQSLIEKTVPADHALPSIFPLASAKSDSEIKILQLRADVVHSPNYEVAGGSTKAWVPRPWIQVSVSFSTRRGFDRLAILYEIDDSLGSFADAIAYENVPPGESLEAVAYLIPSRSQPLVANGREAPLDGFRVALFHRGSVLAIAEYGSRSRVTTNRESGFLRPRSLTPFALIAWDAFLPDAGFAPDSDFHPESAAHPGLTRTSPGR